MKKILIFTSILIFTTSVNAEICEEAIRFSSYKGQLVERGMLSEPCIQCDMEFDEEKIKEIGALALIAGGVLSVASTNPGIMKLPNVLRSIIAIGGITSIAGGAILMSAPSLFISTSTPTYVKLMNNPSAVFNVKNEELCSILKNYPQIKEKLYQLEQSLALLIEKHDESLSLTSSQRILRTNNNHFNLVQRGSSSRSASR